MGANADLVKAEESTALASAEPSEMVAMIERLATNPGVDVSKLAEIIALNERVMDRNARAAFDAAFARMQGKIPNVIERGTADRGDRGGTYRYAKFEDVIRAVRPVLARYGFALSHTTEYPDGGSKLLIIGLLSHEQGHCRRSQFLTAADSGGGKNNVQAMGSAMSYGRRYTTFDLLGIATELPGESDDDGQRSSKPEAPEGFDAWFAGLEVMASEGLPAVSAAFNKSPKEFRDYIAKHRLGDWNSIKATAQAVKRG